MLFNKIKYNKVIVCSSLLIVFIFIGCNDLEINSNGKKWEYSFPGDIKNINLSNSGKYIFVSTEEDNKNNIYILDNKSKIIMNKKVDIGSIDGMVCDNCKIVAYRDIYNGVVNITDFSDRNISRFVSDGNGIMGFWQNCKYLYNYMDIDYVFLRIYEVSTGKKVFDLFEYKEEISTSTCGIKFVNNESILIYDTTGLLYVLNYKDNVAKLKCKFKTYDYYAFIDRIGFVSDKILVSISKEDLSGEILCLGQNGEMLWKKSMPYYCEIYSLNEDFFISLFDTNDKKNIYYVIAMDSNGNDIWKYNGSSEERVKVKLSKSNTLLEIENKNNNKRELLCFNRDGKITFRKDIGKDVKYYLSLDGNVLIIANVKKLEYFEL